MKAARVPFLQAAAIPAIVGGLVAYNQGVPQFSWLFFALAIVANMMVNAGTNLANDYYDHVSGNDEINVNLTPFSGGSRMIQEKILSPATMFRASIICYGIAFVMGIYLGFVTNTLKYLLPIGLFGILFGFFYTAPPLKFGYRGVGEFMVGVALGPLAVMGAYVVQARSLSWSALWPSLSIGLLVAAILYINEFPDYEADKAVGKNHLIVRLGRRRAAVGYYLLLAAIYLSIVVPAALDPMPRLVLITLITLPLAVKAASVAAKNYDDPKGIIPAMGNTIIMHGSIGLLLAFAYVLDRALLR